MAGETKDLDDYLVRAWKETQKNLELLGVDTETQDGESILESWRNNREEPTLRVRRELKHKSVLWSAKTKQANHILIYPGAFNPPHLGHIETLRDGFHNSGPGLNIVGAIVAPTGDIQLQAKEAARNGTAASRNKVMLDQMQRVQLLEGHLKGRDDLRELACKTKLWSFPGLNPFSGYLQVVKQLAALDGFEIEFVSLKGPDHLFFDRPIIHPTYPDCNIIIFTEATRVNEEIWENGEPKPLKGAWEPWSEKPRVAGCQGVVWESKSALESPGGSAVRLLTDKTRKIQTSSTKIRELIVDPPRGNSESLVRELKKAGAISPETLLGFQRKNVHKEEIRGEKENARRARKRLACKSKRFVRKTKRFAGKGIFGGQREKVTTGDQICCP